MGPVPWDIHFCHGNAIVEENYNCFAEIVSNFDLGLLFVISISKFLPVSNFNQIE